MSQVMSPWVMVPSSKACASQIEGSFMLAGESQAFLRAQFAHHFSHADSHNEVMFDMTFCCPSDGTRPTPSGCGIVIQLYLSFNNPCPRLRPHDWSAAAIHFKPSSRLRSR
jgi:hypothetical protein